MIRPLLTISILIGLLMSAAGPVYADGPDGGLDPVRLQLKWHPQFQFAGFYAAKYMGFYRDEGLDVTIIDGGLDRPPVQRVLEGKAEFGVSDADLLLRYLKGEPIVALAAVFQHSPYILMTRQDSGIRSPSDLRDKRVMLSDEQGVTQIKVLLEREGIDWNAMQILPHSYDLQQLIDGKVDAVSAYATVEPFQMRARGVEPGFIRAIDYGIDFYGDTIFTTREQLETNPERVAAFRRASLKGWEYAMSHQDEMVELIAKLPGVADRGTTRELLKREANAMRDLILPGLVELGHMNPGRWEMMARVYASAGEVPVDHRSLDDFMYHRESSGKLPDWFAPAVASAGAAVVISLLAVLWSVQLRRIVGRRTAELHRQIEYGKKTSEQLYFFKWLMDQSADPFYILSPAKGFRFIYANTAACEHFGLSRPDMLSTSIMEINPHFSPAGCGELLENLRQRRSMLFETEHRHSGGRLITVEISTNYLVHDDEEYIAGYFRDISERRRNQETMNRARQEAEAASRAKDHFLAMLSHELRTPLTPVLAEVSALREDEQTPTHLMPMLEMIDRNIRLEARLIDDLLDLTRVSKGKLHLSCEPLDVHLALQRTVEICQPEISRQKLTVNLQLNARHRTISGDTARVHQVFWNLLKNATKFTPKGGKITIATENEVSHTGGPPILRIRFIDSGIGMTKQNLSKIFDAFEQADSAVGRRFGGLGLGLAISRSVVHAHGGTISADSDGQNRGSTFTVRLKTVAAQKAAERKPENKPDLSDSGFPQGGRRVLLVEDNPDTLRVLERLMTRAGWQVRSAESVAQAIAAAGQEEFDILVSDLGLPDGSGFDVMRHLRGKNIRGIALSGYGMDEDVARSRDAGFTAHITKPIDFKSLQQAMRSLERPGQSKKKPKEHLEDSRVSSKPIILRD